MSNLKKKLNDGGRLYLHKIGKCNDDNINAVRIAVNKMLDKESQDTKDFLFSCLYPDAVARLISEGRLSPYFPELSLV